jgi:hypothetical protein
MKLSTVRTSLSGGIALGAAVFVATFLNAGAVSAQPVGPTPCPSVSTPWNTVATPAGGGSCVFGDKEITLIGQTIDNAVPGWGANGDVDFYIVDKTYSFALMDFNTGSNNATGWNPGESASVRGSIRVLDPDYVITSVGLDASVTAGSVGSFTVSKLVFLDALFQTPAKFLDGTNSLTSINGANVAKVLMQGQTLLYFQDNATRSDPATGYAITSWVNSFTQTVVPEIDGLAGTGALTVLAGALALAGERRRRSIR